MPSNKKTEAIDAESRRQAITIQIQNIQAQLGDKQREDDNGVRLTTTEYWAWRKEAQHVLNKKLGELREIKNTILEQRRCSAPPVREAIGHVQNICAIIGIVGEEWAWTPTEQKQIDAAKDFLSRVNAI